MKTRILKPGFELVFSLSLLAIIALPPVLLAQTGQTQTNQVTVQKDIEIKIANGDTLVNGKQIGQLSAADRMEALKDIRHIDTRDSAGFAGMNRRIAKMSMITRDSTGNKMTLHRYRPLRKRMFAQGGPAMPADMKNSQNFDYVSTDNDGMSTHVRFHVADASDVDLKRMEYVEGPKFEISDLNIAPRFESGKTMLTFSLPSKSPAQVKLSNSQGKLVWADKATGGTFSKSFSLVMNGIYFLQVKQGGSYCVKRIMKEE